MQRFLIGNIVSLPLSVRRRLHVSPTGPSCDIYPSLKLRPKDYLGPTMHFTNALLLAILAPLAVGAPTSPTSGHVNRALNDPAPFLTVDATKGRREELNAHAERALTDPAPFLTVGSSKDKRDAKRDLDWKREVDGEMLG